MTITRILVTTNSQKLKLKQNHFYCNSCVKIADASNEHFYGISFELDVVDQKKKGKWRNKNKMRKKSFGHWSNIQTLMRIFIKFICS